MVEAIVGMGILFIRLYEAEVSQQAEMLRDRSLSQRYLAGQGVKWGDAVFQEMREDSDSGGVGKGFGPDRLAERD